MTEWFTGLPGLVQVALIVVPLYVLTSAFLDIGKGWR